jgi:hypothetical protein
MKLKMELLRVWSSFFKEKGGVMSTSILKNTFEDTLYSDHISRTTHMISCEQNPTAKPSTWMGWG